MIQGIHSGKFKIFLPLRFYVKPILAIAESHKQPFSAAFKALNFDFGRFQPIELGKTNQNENTEPQKLSK